MTTVTLQQIECLADIIEEATGNWSLANWIRSQEQEIQAELARRLHRARPYRGREAA